MTTESDPLVAFRTELKRRREALGLDNIAELGRQAGISGERWAVIERGYELKGGVQVRANPKRSNLIKMALAVEWDPADALAAAGMAPLKPSEERASDARTELTRLLPSLSGARVRALLYVARTMKDPDALEPAGVPGFTPPDPRKSPDPNTRAVGRTHEGPTGAEPVEECDDEDGCPSLDGQE